MSYDPHDTIKTHFARKSSAQLQEIVQGNDLGRWSPEALAVAAAVLQDRIAGRAPEPHVTEEEPAPPLYHYKPEQIALGVLGGLLTGCLVIPYYRRITEDPDLPVPFGPRMAWLALETTTTEEVASALDLQAVEAATWTDGIQAAHQSSVFVTPPLGDWTLVVGTALFPHNRTETFVKPLLERLSGQFGDAQYFCTHSDLKLHIWARARKGRLLRGFGWLGEQHLTFWDEGAPTKEERSLRLRFATGPSISVEQARTQKISSPDENCVMQLAYLWSIDPTTLNEQFKEPVMGFLGDATGSSIQCSQ